MAVKPDFKCPQHGEYRRYITYMNRLKKWSLILCSSALIPLTIFLDVLNIKLGWLYLFMGVVVGSAVIPISLTVYWTRLTAEGMIAGAVGGCVAGQLTSVTPSKIILFVNV
jgi:Na+/proline symporter